MTELPANLFEDGPLPTVPELVQDKGLKRDEAREVLQALRKAQEADLEASISAEDHLNKLINLPLKEEIDRITMQNRKLALELHEANSTTERTPQEIEALIAENTKQLLNIKRALAESRKAEGQAGGTNLTIDLGSIFHDALSGAREVSID